MARRKRGRDISGWLLIDKPAGVSSSFVVNKVKWALDSNKAGHAGTLDPEATGLLAVALGEATKTVPYITDALKAYEFEVIFGAATNTDDAEGAVIARSDKRPQDADIHAALERFRGHITQIPPQYSAVKVDGQRAYALARAGEDLDLAARPLYVERLEMVGRDSLDSAVLELVCGKGGYVRAIARDLGEDLGCYGHVAWLRRLWSGPFDLAQAVTLDAVEAAAKTTQLDGALLPLEYALDGLPHLRATEQGAQRMRCGNPGQVLDAAPEYGDQAWASFGGKPIAIGTYLGGELHPSRVFNL
ncbi:tRNA pseudouridine(55) synthase TruB [Rhodobacteraceae bacterium XHP0102]|nr:tRNA pseudouridine(55) synthase TruB [Rhodobacteraceae bacterium XHP0102]